MAEDRFEERFGPYLLGELTVEEERDDGAHRRHAQLEPRAQREVHGRQPGAEREDGDGVGQQADAGA